MQVNLKIWWRRLYHKRKMKAEKHVSMTGSNELFGGARLKGTPVWQCNICHKKFQKKIMAISHVLNKHGGKKDESSDSD